jgi:hypothetical protein
MNQDEQSGIRVVLSAPQLAAILTQETIGDAALQSNRLWGGLRVAGMVVELLGAAVLRAVPTPALASSVGSVLFGVAAGQGGEFAGQLMDPQVRPALSNAALALTLGSGEWREQHVGLAVDIAVPLAMAGLVSATRVASIRAGRINLLMHESAADGGADGHPILPFVDRHETELLASLAADPELAMAASFSSVDELERVLSSALRANTARIAAWSTQALAGAGGQLALTPYSVSRIIGHGVARTTHTLQSLTRMQLLLRLQLFNQQPFYVVMARPMP